MNFSAAGIHLDGDVHEFFLKGESVLEIWGWFGKKFPAEVEGDGTTPLSRR